MNTKYNIGDVIKIPFTIESISITDKGVNYYLKREISESLIMNYPSLDEEGIKSLTNN